MSVLHVELPPQVQSELTELGLIEESALAAWVADAVRQRLAAAKQLAYPEGRAARGDRDAFHQVLAEVPAVEPAAEDHVRVHYIFEQYDEQGNCVYSESAEASPKAIQKVIPFWAETEDIQP